MSIEVIQPYKPEVIQFSSPDDFNIYYSKHSDDFNETTYKLNVKYKIPGFKITKLKGELKLIKDYAKTKLNSNTETNADNKITENFTAKIDSLTAKIDSLTKRLENVEHYLTNL